MKFDTPVLNPPFNITRSSHTVLTAKDLEASKYFYTELIGLIVSDEDENALYLRGREERGHHSLVLKKSAGERKCERLGMRMLTDEDIKRAHDWFNENGYDATFVDVPYQGLTLHVSDNCGLPLEFCAEMDAMPRQMYGYNKYTGASAQRIDHWQTQTSDVAKSADFYHPLGFRASEYTFSDNDEGGLDLWGIWMQRKGNPHDIVFTSGPGPRLHHFAYLLRDAADLVHACDVAGSLGFNHDLERGPGRHGISGAMFIYFRDPDGHRIELFNTHYQHIDLEPPIAWNLKDPKRADQWGMPAQEKWFTEATEFAGVGPSEPILKAPLPTLEKFLEKQKTGA